MKQNLFFLLILLSLPLKSQEKDPKMQNEKTPWPCRIIYQIDVNVKSKRVDKNSTPLYKFALLDICPPKDEKEIPQRQVVEVEWRSEKQFREIVNIEKIFEDRQAALVYARIKHIPMAYLENQSTKVEFPFYADTHLALPKDLRADWVIQSIEKKLPKDWVLIQQQKEKTFENEGYFTLQGRFKIWELFENKINAPINNQIPPQNEERIKKNGREVYPYIYFRLGQPWTAQELEAISKEEKSRADNHLDRFFYNTQYYGLTVVEYRGVEDEMHSVLYPPRHPTTYQVYEILRNLLHPVTITGKAQNTKSGAAILSDKKEMYFIDDPKGDWSSWGEAMLDKNVTVSGILVSKSLDEPLKNEKGEYKAGQQGEINYLINAKLLETEKK